MAYKKYDAYHLGMQPEEVKDALENGGGGGSVATFDAPYVTATEKFMQYDATLGDAVSTDDFNAFVDDFMSKNPRININLTQGLITFSGIIYYLTAKQYATIVQVDTNTGPIASVGNFYHDEENHKVLLCIYIFIEGF